MMRSATPSPAGREQLIRKLESIGDLSAEEKAALYALPMRVTTLPDGQDIVAEGDRPSSCCLVLGGFVCRYRLLAEGRRQIVSFHVPGEIPDLQSLHLKTMDHTVGTLAD